MAYGTLSVLDTLAASSTASIAQFGEDKAYAAIEIALAAHNQIMNEMIANLVEFTNDQQRRTGADSTMVAQELDEFGVPAPQKLAAGANLGFPLRRQGNALQWTRDFMNTKTGPELVAQVNAVMRADRAMIERDIKRALFLSTNYTFTDRLTNNLDLAVKRLANADSFPLPPAPDGSSFTASTHTHYVARVGTLAASDISAVISNVREHFASGTIELDINSAQEAAVRGFTSNFTPRYDARLIQANTVTRAAEALDVTNTYDREIGFFDSAEVAVRPWVPANYLVARLVGEPVLVARTRNGQGVGALELVGDFDAYPLRCQMWRRDLGFGVQNRVGAAVLYIGAATTYADPSL